MSTITWGLHATPANGSAQVSKIIWVPELSLFVGVMNSGTSRVVTSPTGVTWTLQTASQINSWRSVAWSPTLNLLVAVASSGTNRVMTSANGTAWFNQTSSEQNSWHDVTWSPSLALFVAVSSDGTNRVMTSSNGTAWSPQSASSAKTWQAVTWSSSLGLFVAVAGTSGTASVMTSTNGTAWSGQTTSVTTTFRARGLAWSPSLGMFAACSGGSHLLTSTNGTAWSDWSGVPSGWGATDNNQVVWSPELSLFLVTGGNYEDVVLTSPDGVVWTAVNVTTFDTWDAVAYSPALTSFVLAAQLGGGSGIPINLGTGVVAPAISPTSGTIAGGTTLTLTGDGSNGGFVQGQTLVYLDTTANLATYTLDPLTDRFTNLGSPECTSVTVTSSTSLTCITPSHLPTPALKTLVVLGPGTSPTAPNIVFYLPDAFTSLSPILISISPVTGNEGTLVTLTGTNFYADQDVNVSVGGQGVGKNVVWFFDGVLFNAATSVTYVNATTLTCLAPFSTQDTVVDVVLHPGSVLLGYIQGAASVAETTLSDAFTYTSAWWQPDWPKVILPPINYPGPCDVLLEGELHAGTVATLYTPVDLVSSGGTAPYSLSVLSGDLPPGLRLEDDALVGTPTENGVYTFILQSEDSEGCSAYVGYTIIIWAGDEDFVPFPFPWDDISPTIPPPYTIPFPFTPVGGFPTFPPGTIFSWRIDSTPPTDKGWWISADEDFAGAGQVISGSVPANPRGLVEIVAFATGTSSFLAGTIACTWRNRLLYAKGGYTVGTTLPTIRIFDGLFDREVVSIPLAASSVVPIAVMSILTANDTIYLSTLDSGTTSANWSGRVFTLDPDRDTLTPIGDPFPAGHVPYALAWHLGRLWAGTNRGDPASPGKVFFFRPDIDTAWTEDHDLSAESLGGVCSLLSFEGLLYVGTSSSGTAAKVLVRSGLGVYTTSDTGTASAAGNAFIALYSFEGKLYSSYWSPATVSLLRKFSSGAWSTSYTGVAGTLVPYVALVVDLSSSILLALGGGTGFSAALVTTPDGITWTDKTVFLDQSTPASSGLPAFGVISL